MLAAINYYMTVLFVLLQLSFSAMVLPRPPASSNYIQEDQGLSDRKIYERKFLQNYLQSSNVERPNTNDYSLLEIELRSPDEMDTTNLENIVHAMLKQSRHIRNDSYPNPEVIPHSIYGVRDVGLTSNFKLNSFDEDKHILIGPSKIRKLDEKLYYVKNNRPKVYINVRGHSGSFRKDFTPKTTSSVHPIQYLRVTPAFQTQTDRKSQQGRKIRLPKKNDENSHRSQKNIFRNGNKKPNRFVSVYGSDDLSTTENSMVTSSELPKQIPAPPPKHSSINSIAQTTPVQRYAFRKNGYITRI